MRVARSASQCRYPANTNETHPINAVPVSAAPLANVDELTQVLIHACCAQLSRVNSRITDK